MPNYIMFDGDGIYGKKQLTGNFEKGIDRSQEFESLNKFVMERRKQYGGIEQEQGN
ncbi:unnamed protein product [Paramecium sonneborni]|uniref:Uncharacterized protein n=1 Tax=Paramecium sonneborni TaxID=65129 RepID=A0A8S1MMS0_9CILI|nr:unnamed protein product [Paramecium sonneborni]